jgi:ABC-2 type transport system ATP-binding protein
MNGVAAGGLSVLVSSHIVTDLERVCDYLILLAGAQVQLAGDIEAIVQRHKLLVGPARDTSAVAHLHRVIQERRAERTTTLLVETAGPIFDPTWDVRDVTLEQVILGYLAAGRVGLELERTVLAPAGVSTIEEGQ